MIYLDYQATTPLAPEAREAMLAWLGGPDTASFGNPHSAHRAGRMAAAAVEVAREQVAGLLPPGGRVIFTSGATEALNLAILGRRPKQVVVSSIEHAAVLDTVGALGGLMHVLPVDAEGLVDPDAAIPPGTDLVALMQVNNEVGTIQPVAAIAARAHAAGALLLCDAVQGAGKLAAPEGADMIAISAHKLYGPKGIGALWLRDGVELSPTVHGGGQEGGMRSGTLSPALCAGFGAAASLCISLAKSDGEQAQTLWETAVAALPGWTLNGNAAQRWHGNLNLRRDGLDVARLMSDCRDLAFSAGSACASGSGRPSHFPASAGAIGCPGKILYPDWIRTLYKCNRGRGCLRYNTSRDSGAGRLNNVVKVNFITADGQLATAQGAVGASLLAVSQAAGMALEGTCEGQMACSTCHVVVAPDWFARLKPASNDEEDMLDLAAGVARTSRLSCQILLSEELDGLEVRIPGESRDMQRG